VAEYLIDRNAIVAYKRAGYQCAGNAAEAAASRLRLQESTGSSSACEARAGCWSWHVFRVFHKPTFVSLLPPE
jgi:hypothetical protein